MNTCLIQTAHSLLGVPAIRQRMKSPRVVKDRRLRTPAELDREMTAARRQGKKIP